MSITRDDLVDAIVSEGLKLEHPPVKLEELAERVADHFGLECDAPIRTRIEGVKSTVRSYDLIKEQDYVYPNGKRKAKIVKGQVVRRDSTTITHIVVHQTDVEYGVSSHQLKRSGGDRNLALARRALDVACHVFATRSGFYVKTHDLTDLVWHGNGYNDFSLGIEIEGTYPGLESDPEGTGRKDKRPTKLSAQTVRAACAAIQYLVVAGRGRGMPLTHIAAHRQSSPTRRRDPGEAIWKQVVLDYAVRELGLIIEHDRTLRTRKGLGRPIPREWDPNGIGVY